MADASNAVGATSARPWALSLVARGLCLQQAPTNRAHYADQAGAHHKQRARLGSGRFKTGYKTIPLTVAADAAPAGERATVGRVKGHEDPAVRVSAARRLQDQLQVPIGGIVR